jgi:hypothetical protein
LKTDRLDTVSSDLVTRVERIAGDDSTALYAFSVSADDRVLVTGRAAISFILDAQQSTTDGASSTQELP